VAISTFGKNGLLKPRIKRWRLPDCPLANHAGSCRPVSVRQSFFQSPRSEVVRFRVFFQLSKMLSSGTLAEFGQEQTLVPARIMRCFAAGDLKDCTNENFHGGRFAHYFMKSS
jgi:hypothetical protein